MARRIGARDEPRKRVRPGGSAVGRHLGFLVDALGPAGPDEDVSGMDALIGEYLPCGEVFDGQPVYKKAVAGGGPDAANKQCYLYYYGGGEAGEDEENIGWWFGQDIGGSMVFCFARKEGFPPPLNGWCIPAEEEIPVRSLRVTQIGDESHAPKHAPAKVRRQDPIGATVSEPFGAGPGVGPGVGPAPLQPQQPRNAPRSLPAQGQQRHLEGQFAAGGGQPKGLMAALTQDELRDGARYLRLELAAGPEALLVGMRLACDSFPPVIMEVRAGSLAANHGVKPGFQLLMVNQLPLSDRGALERGKAILRQRPLALEVKDPGRMARVQAAVEALQGR